MTRYPDSNHTAEGVIEEIHFGESDDIFQSPPMLSFYVNTGEARIQSFFYGKEALGFMFRNNIDSAEDLEGRRVLLSEGAPVPTTQKYTYHKMELMP